MINRRGIKRAFKYSVVGGGTFVFDLALLFIFVDFFSWNEPISAGVAFLIAVSLNYFISRRFVFKETQRNINSGYIIFLGIVGVGFLTVTGLMYVAIEVLAVNYLIARVFIAGLVGIFNYLTNLYFNFKVHKQ